METPLLSGESLQKSGVANCQRGVEAVGGILYCTDKRLIFESHMFNVQKGTTIIELSHIVNVRPVLTKAFGVVPLVPNSIEVQLQNGQRQSFVVNGRSHWLTAINQLRTHTA